MVFKACDFQGATSSWSETDTGPHRTTLTLCCQALGLREFRKCRRKSQRGKKSSIRGAPLCAGGFLPIFPACFEIDVIIVFIQTRKKIQRNVNHLLINT